MDVLSTPTKVKTGSGTHTPAFALRTLAEGNPQDRSGLQNIGTWIRNPIAYELGARTVTSETFKAVADVVVAERGAVLVREMGMLRYLFDPRGAWGQTLWQGPTPGGLISLAGLGKGLGAFGGGCGCN